MHSKPTHDTKEIRADIDKVDREILRLLAERRAHSRRIAMAKDLDSRPTRDIEREESLLSDRLELAQGHGLDPGLIIELWRAIMDDSVNIQLEMRGGEADVPSAMRIAIQGIEGSYSHLAARQFFQSRGRDVQFVLAPTFSEAVDRMAAGKADVAFLPVENSTSGVIAETYDLLMERDIHVVGEVHYVVRHCLLGLPGASVSDVKRIYGHPQAIAQCSDFLSSLDGVEVIYQTDTALSGKRIAELGQPMIGAIASEEAARLYELQVLKAGIANRPRNTTRFLVVAGAAINVPRGSPAKTSVAMAVSNRPGALMRALSVFKEAEINLVKLESRTIPTDPQLELFYLDFEGTVSDPSVSTALDAVRHETGFLRVLGSYPSTSLPRTTGSPRVARSMRRTGPRTPASRSVEDSTLGYRLASLEYKPSRTIVEVGDARIGNGELTMIAGPCAVESWEQVFAAAQAVAASGASILRGGCFKPRTSRYAFQGLGLEGLEMLAEAGKVTGLPIVTEVTTPHLVDKVAQKADILQIGTRNMQNFALLQAVGRINRPVLLKRGMSSSIDEFLQAAEYILAEGNQRVILCERGIRTFETATRNTLDISAVPVLRSKSHLPVIVDPSHAAGARELVTPLALAADAVGADGVMVEVHPDPDNALSDGPQSLTPQQFHYLMGALGYGSD